MYSKGLNMFDFAIFLHEQRIDKEFYSNKPSDEEVIQSLLKDGYTLKEGDILYLYNVLPSIGDLLYNRSIEVNFTYPLPTPVTGLKLDDNKPMVGTLVQVFPRALMEIGRCIEKGQEKYPQVDNWKRVINPIPRYQNSLMRHLIKHNMGIINDRDDNLLHLSHMAWNALAMLELYLEQQQIDKKEV